MTGNPKFVIWKGTWDLNNSFILVAFTSQVESTDLQCSYLVDKLVVWVVDFTKNETCQMNKKRYNMEKVA